MHHWRRCRDQQLTFDRFLRYDELTSWLRATAAAHPEPMTVESYGHSDEGRDLLLATVTDLSTGAHDNAVTRIRNWYLGAR